MCTSLLLSVIAVYLYYFHLAADKIGKYYYESPFITEVRCTTLWQNSSPPLITMDVKGPIVSVNVSLVYGEHTLLLRSTYPVSGLGNGTEVRCFYHTDRKTLVLPSGGFSEDVHTTALAMFLFGFLFVFVAVAFVLELRKHKREREE